MDLRGILHVKRIQTSKEMNGKHPFNKYHSVVEFKTLIKVKKVSGLC